MRVEYEVSVRATDEVDAERVAKDFLYEIKSDADPEFFAMKMHQIPHGWEDCVPYSDDEEDGSTVQECFERGEGHAREGRGKMGTSCPSKSPSKDPEPSDP